MRSDFEQWHKAGHTPASDRLRGPPRGLREGLVGGRARCGLWRWQSGAGGRRKRREREKVDVDAGVRSKIPRRRLVGGSSSAKGASLLLHECRGCRLKGSRGWSQGRLAGVSTAGKEPGANHQGWAAVLVTPRCKTIRTVAPGTFLQLYWVMIYQYEDRCGGRWLSTPRLPSSLPAPTVWFQ